VAGVGLLALAGTAAAHGGGAARGFTSSVTAVRPTVAGLEVRVLEGDDRVELRVSGHDVVILGYRGEPYLWFSETGVRRNDRSPATYLNDARYGDVELPAVADPDLPPLWQQVAGAGRPYDWHDHRIHWMSRSDPPVVVADGDRPHRIFDWSIPGTVDGRPLAIEGRLDYAPLPGRSFPRLLLVPLGVLVLATAAVLLWRRRQRTAAAVAS
jgi:hypothetical protein